MSRTPSVKAVLAPAGGANLLFTGAAESFALREVKAPDLLGLAARPAAVGSAPPT